MDIEFLLWLQNLRESTGNLFTPFVLGYSDVSTHGCYSYPCSYTGALIRTAECICFYP